MYICTALQYKLYQFTCITAQAVHIYMSYSTRCTDLHVLQYKLYKFTCHTVEAVQIYLHVLQYKLYKFTGLTVQAE
jgi:hypothetical protein